MKWFTARLIFHIRQECEIVSSQFDHSIRLITAGNIEHATEKAYELGQQLEDSFVNTRNERVIWKFIDVASIFEIENPEDAMEVFSLTSVEEEPEMFIRTMQYKSMPAQANPINQSLIGE